MWPEVLELAQLLEHHGEPEMDVGRRGVDPELDAQRTTRASLRSRPPSGRQSTAFRASQAAVCGGRRSERRRGGRAPIIGPMLDSRRRLGSPPVRRTLRLHRRRSRTSPWPATGAGAGHRSHERRRRHPHEPRRSAARRSPSRRPRRRWRRDRDGRPAQAEGQEAAAALDPGRPRRAGGGLDHLRDDDGGRLRPARRSRTSSSTSSEANSYLYDDHWRPIGIFAPPNHDVIDTYGQISPVDAATRSSPWRTSASGPTPASTSAASPAPSWPT